jgi:hypothetical protein
MAFYSIVNINNEIVFSQITTDPNYPIGEGQQLLLDETPEYDSLTQYIVRINPVPIGSDRVVYEIVDFPNEIFCERVRAERDEKLFKSDWTQVNDVALTSEQINLWKIYRQELRDITTQSGFPLNVVWPVQPE